MPQTKHTSPSHPGFISGYRIARPHTVNALGDGTSVKNHGVKKMLTANRVLMAKSVMMAQGRSLYRAKVAMKMKIVGKA